MTENLPLPSYLKDEDYRRLCAHCGNLTTGWYDCFWIAEGVPVCRSCAMKATSLKPNT